MHKNRFISCSSHPWLLCLPLILSISCHSSRLTDPWCCWSEWESWCSWRGECLSSLQWSLHHLLLLFPLLPPHPLRCPTHCSRTGIRKCSAGWTRWRIFSAVVEAEDSLLYTNHKYTSMKSANALQISTELEWIVKDVPRMHVNGFNTI